MKEKITRKRLANVDWQYIECLCCSQIYNIEDPVENEYSPEILEFLSHVKTNGIHSVSYSTVLSLCGLLIPPRLHAQTHTHTCTHNENGCRSCYEQPPCQTQASWKYLYHTCCLHLNASCTDYGESKTPLPELLLNKEVRSSNPHSPGASVVSCWRGHWL